MPDRPASAASVALQPHIESRILLLREQRVLLDADLAELYRGIVEVYRDVRDGDPRGRRNARSSGCAA